MNTRLIARCTGPRPFDGACGFYSAPLAMNARLIARCTGPRPFDGACGFLRKFGWCCHFVMVWRTTHSAGGVLRPPSTYTTASWRTNSRSRGSWSPKRSTIFSAMKWCRISQPTRRCSASGTMSLTPRFMRACPQGAGDAHFSARPLRAEICVAPVCELSAVGLAHVYRGVWGRYARGTCAVHARYMRVSRLDDLACRVTPRRPVFLDPDFSPIEQPAHGVSQGGLAHLMLFCFPLF